MYRLHCALLLVAMITFQSPAQRVSAGLTRDEGCSRCDWDTETIVIRDGWLQEAPPAQKITAAYMVIENHGDADIYLRSASTEVAEVIELHKMELADGMMKMRRVDSINIPGGSAVELKPGGYHLMVIGLNRTLTKGDKVSITLQFSNEIKKTITIPVKPRSAMVKEGQI